MAQDALIDKQFGEFTVKEVVGRGGMATVYRAEQPLMRRDVALKVIRLNDVADKNRDFSARFASEAKLIASLEHPNILPVYSYGITGEYAYLAMRFLRGGTLEDLLNGEPMPLEYAIRMFQQFAHGLAYAHSKGIIHRDIKPSNILLDEEDNAYLTDFGLAKLIDAEAGFTKTGQIMGTPVYMSPEQLKGEALDFRSDVYALGCLLYEMLTGSPPFSSSDGDVIPVIFKHLQTHPEAPSERNPSLPPAFDAVVLRALAKAPADRYPSVRDMANDLNKAIGKHATLSFPQPAETIINRTQPIQLRQDHVRTGLIAAIVTLVAAVLGVTLLLVRTEQERRDTVATNFAAAVTAQQAIALAETQTAIASHPRYDPDQIRLGESGNIEDYLPTQEEMEVARSIVGANGFIALVPCNTSSEYHAALTRELAQFAREAGIPTRVYDPDSDAYQQLTLLERAIADNATGIVLCPLDLELIAPTMWEVRRARIPFVSQASNMGQYGGVQVLTDAALLGQVPGEYIGQLVADQFDGVAKVVVLTFDDLPDVKARADGMVDGLLKYAPNAEIVARVRGATPGWAQESIEALLADGVEFNVILTINDAGGFGALAALEAAGVPYDDVVIGSVDAEVLAQRYIREGKYFKATVEAGRTEYASAAVSVMMKMLAGASVPEFTLIPPGELITADTLQSEP
ncbi:MAG: protein kinase [Anaerolineae bacterium]|nr:protein kinase [Anaerolineae bacterium]